MIHEEISVNNQVEISTDLHSILELDNAELKAKIAMLSEEVIQDINTKSGVQFKTESTISDIVVLLAAYLLKTKPDLEERYKSDEAKIECLDAIRKRAHVFVIHDFESWVAYQLKNHELLLDDKPQVEDLYSEKDLKSLKQVFSTVFGIYGAFISGQYDDGNQLEKAFLFIKQKNIKTLMHELAHIVDFALHGDVSEEEKKERNKIKKATKINRLLRISFIGTTSVILSGIFFMTQKYGLSELQTQEIARTLLSGGAGLSASMNLLSLIISNNTNLNYKQIKSELFADSVANEFDK